MSTSLLLLTFFVPLLTQEAIPSNSQNCFAVFKDFGSTFDVCDLQTFAGTSLPYYTVDDTKNSDGNDQYEYYFNIGGSLPVDPPSVCSSSDTKSHQYCADLVSGGYNWNCTNLINITANAWAYQAKLDKNGTTPTKCFYLSNFNGGEPRWRLINDQNPVDGVQLTYLNGDYDRNCGINREFSIKFQCENTGARFIPSTQSNIDEFIPCAYTWTVNSLYGCPTECPQQNNQLCSAKGLCSYDNTNNQARCYCYGEYGGRDCSIPNTDETGSNIAKAKPAQTEYVHTFLYSMNDKISNNVTQTVNITYDLSNWAIDTESNYYKVFDKFNNSNRSYVYYMGIMKKIHTTDLGCHSVPTDNSGGDIDWAYAVQMDTHSQECFSLGTAAEWNLFDTIDNPAHGVTLNYTDSNGQECSSGVKREFSVSLVCPDEVFEKGAKNEQTFDSRVSKTISTYVEETSECKYNIRIESAFACPYQCVTPENDKGFFDVCSNHGLCVADPYMGRVRCLCDDTWNGALCNTNPTLAPTLGPTPNPTLKPTLKPTKGPTRKPTQKPTPFPSSSPMVPIVVIEASHDDHSAFVISIVGLCAGVIVAVCIGWFCYKRMKNTHEEFKEYTKFRDNSEKKKGISRSIGFSMKGAKLSNVADDSDEDNENGNYREDQLL